MTQVSAECADCGAPIEISGDTADARASCPRCGGVKRAYHASMTGGVPSNYMLDNYVAHKLSLLTGCGACELSTDTNWLNHFIINSVFSDGYGNILPFACNCIVLVGLGHPG